MSEAVRNFITGSWSDAIEGKRFASLNPADNRETMRLVEHAYLAAGQRKPA